MSDLFNKVITVKAKEEKAGPFGPLMKIKDQDGKTYTVFKTKKDGSVSVAWEQMPELEATVQIGYAEEDGEYEGKPFKRRTIRSFNADIGNGVANAKETRYEPLSASQSESKEDFGRRLAVHGFLNAQINCKGLEIITVEDVRLAIVLEDMVNLELAKPKGWAELGQKLKEEAVEEISTEDIPF